MLNTPLLLVSALFFLALISVLYLVAWLTTSALLLVGRRYRLSQIATKRLLMSALVLPPLLAVLPTVAGATLRHLHSGGLAAEAAGHHSTGCQAMFTRLASLGRIAGGTATSALISGSAWLLIGIGVALVFRLAWATVRLERGLAPYLAAPSPRLSRSLERVKLLLPGLPTACFFECPIPSGYSSVLGFWHARCVVSQEFVAGASEEELDALVSHEGSHLLARDVIATFLVGALNCVFFFLRPVRLLGRSWREAAELASDDAAVAATRNPLAMAAAILKASGVSVPFADLAPAPRLPAIALPFADGAACSPSKRVERLIAQAQHAAFAAPVESRLQVAGGWIMTGAFAIGGVWLLGSSEAACFVHCALEALVKLL